MGSAVKSDKVKDQTTAPPRDRPDLTAEQRELLDSRHRSCQQAARGETRPAREFLEAWRLEREADANESRNSV